MKPRIMRNSVNGGGGGVRRITRSHTTNANVVGTRPNVFLTTLCIQLLVIIYLCSAAPASPPTNATQQQQSLKASASNEKTNTDNKANSNVYGSNNNSHQTNANGRPVSRGYNQGYSYNTGIKPYRTGYTYYQPFGDAVNEQNGNNSGGGDDHNNSGNGGGSGGATISTKGANSAGGSNGGAAAAPEQPPPPIPVELTNMFGIDPKQFGPVKVIPNQNVPLDENGIPQLDAIKIPQENVQNIPVQALQQRQQPPPPVPAAAPPVSMNGNDFGMGNDFNLNQILGTNQPPPPPPTAAPYNPMNDNSMFDFSPPSTQNFNIANGGGGGGNGNGNGGGGFVGDDGTRANNPAAPMPIDAPDYNRLNNFAGNLNNFDTYLGEDDPTLPMLGSPGGGGGGGNGGGNGGGGPFGFAGQQVPSEIVNLNNAFGTGPVTNNNNNGNRGGGGNDMADLVLNQLSQGNGNGGGGGGNGGGLGNGMDLGSFGSASSNNNNRANSFFPFANLNF